MARTDRQHADVARRRVLVIDDDVELQAFLSMVLEGHGYMVFSALTASHGLDLLDVVEPDLVLLDATISGTDALELTKVIGQVHCRPAVVMLADREPNRADWELAEAVGVADIIESPFEVDDLLERLARVVGPRRDVRLH